MTKVNYIPRNLYFNQIEPYIGSGLIKVITGQRRIGKSYVLLQVMEEIVKRYPDARIIYINKEDYQFEAIKTHDHLKKSGHNSIGSVFGYWGYIKFSDA
jgi:predicted AAA+ superfamily ATPase